MIPLSMAEIAEIVGGRLHRCRGSDLVTGTVEFDSRRIAPGDLFVAIPGERVDGHSFAAEAVRRGAVGVLAAREVDVPAVIVPPAAGPPAGVYALAGDSGGAGAAVLAALGALARHVVERLADTTGMRTIAITGSAGKTSTKDLIADLLTPLGPTIAAPGSFNNEVGMPWTALRADEETAFLVLEYSARGAGHIAGLCRTVPPRVGAVLNVGTAHLEEFGSRGAIARAKGELVEALPAAGQGGVAVLNLDDPLVAAMAERTVAEVLGVGQTEAAAVRAADVGLDEQARPRFTLVTPRGSRPVELALHGAHQVGNALAAAAVGLRAGASLEAVADGLSAALPRSGKRMEVRTRADDIVVINDAYNAGPEAMRHALSTLATIAESATPQRRSVAVLGPMLELGESSESVHEEIGALAGALGLGKLICVGDGARAIRRGAAAAGVADAVSVPDVDAAITALSRELVGHDVVLVKASNSVGLWRVADAVLDGGSHAEGTGA
jgi:UDP-N-acetylmuramoyl-tripeptide--D-alanyl-D-alanine ligase